MSSPRHPVGASEAVSDVRTRTRVLTLTPSGIRSSSRWSPARIGGGVMSTRTSSEDAAPARDSPPVDDETPDAAGAFPRLTDDQVATLEVGGSRRSVRAGEVLIREGAPSNDFF
eukprot:gene26329-31661_t